MSWFVYVVRFAPGIDRDGIAQALGKLGIPARPYFLPIHLQPYMVERFGYQPGDFPVTEDLGRRGLALPFSGVMSEAQVERVCQALYSAMLKPKLGGNSMNPAMWRKALQVIPHVSKEEWQKLDIISKLADRHPRRRADHDLPLRRPSPASSPSGRAVSTWWHWLLVTFGLILAHATNNLLNDYTDYVRGVDQDNYYRAQYGPQPLVHGLLTKRQLLTYAAVTGLMALACGHAAGAAARRLTLLLLGLGVFFVLFYTWPLKYIALGEIAVLIVWGPLMIGGGYYVITGSWDWNVVIASLPYALGVTGVIFGKHIDKYETDKERKHPHPAGGDRRESRPGHPGGHADPAVPVHLLSDRHRLLHPGHAGRAAGAAHLPADLADVQGAQAGRKTGRFPGCVAELLRRRRLSSTTAALGSGSCWR